MVWQDLIVRNSLLLNSLVWLNKKKQLIYSTYSPSSNLPAIQQLSLLPLPQNTAYFSGGGSIHFEHTKTGVKNIILLWTTNVLTFFPFWFQLNPARQLNHTISPSGTIYGIRSVALFDSHDFIVVELSAYTNTQEISFYHFFLSKVEDTNRFP